ncbi:MAG: outer membrane beta-barrel protein [Planctomycetes bacterium]|nr:outer membrane beta-barrel protein [Planctomycetota bacterium]
MRSLILTSLLLCLAVGTAPAAIIGGNVNALLGVRVMSDDAFDTYEVDQQPLFGVQVDLALPILLHVEFGFLASTESGHNGVTNTDITFYDVFAGLNKTWEIGPAHPFIGAGVTTRVFDLSQEAVEDDDADLGGYIHSGAFWRVGDHFNIGLDARYTFGSDMDFQGSQLDVSNIVGALILGYGW